MLRFAALALLATAAAGSAFAQAPAPMPLVESEAAPPVDPMLIGAWTLSEVEDAGPFDRFGAQIQAIRFAFDAEGEGEASATILQDGATYVRESTFRFGCEDGTIVSEDHPTIRYELLDGGSLRLTDATGLAVRLAPADLDTASR